MSVYCGLGFMGMCSVLCAVKIEDTFGQSSRHICCHWRWIFGKDYNFKYKKIDLISFKGVIKFYFQQCQLQTVESVKQSQHSNITFDLTQVTLTVHFVEYLEKLIYNAYEGTAESLHPVQKVEQISFSFELFC